jgi:hypothetical protein
VRQVHHDIAARRRARDGGRRVSGERQRDEPDQHADIVWQHQLHLPSLFQFFSPQKVFTALGSNVLEVGFFVPGSNTPALTRGFGLVFTNVTLSNTTSITFFDASNASLGTFFAEPGGTRSLSFLGVDFRVEITNGYAALGPDETPRIGPRRNEQFCVRRASPRGVRGLCASGWGLLALGLLGGSRAIYSGPWVRRSRYMPR